MHVCVCNAHSCSHQHNYRQFQSIVCVRVCVCACMRERVCVDNITISGYFIAAVSGPVPKAGQTSTQNAI